MWQIKRGVLREICVDHEIISPWVASMPEEPHHRGNLAESKPTI